MPVPVVLFVCRSNAGKSQMAEALMRQVAGDAVEVHSAGTHPKESVNALSAEAVSEVGADMGGAVPTGIDPALLVRADRVVVLGTEARVEPVEGMRAAVDTWVVDEPSERGVDGLARMRLVRDDISDRVADLALELTGRAPESGQRHPQLVAEMAARFEGVFTEAEVRSAVRQAHASLAGRSRISAYLPVLVERFAKELLEARAVVEGRSAKALPELLFVCVHNAGRSQMAAAMARHLSGGRVKVRSAGSRPTGQINPLVQQVLRERGIELTDAFPKPLTTDVLQASDVIVTMGCGDECPYFPGRRYEDWPVADPAAAGIEQVREIAADVQGRVEALLEELVGLRSGRPAQ